MNVYFHIDELNRDAIVASALKQRFSASGHNLVYGNRITNRLLRYFHSAFDVIIMPRPHIVYDNWGDEWLSWDAKFIMLSTESLGIICKDHDVMARTILEKEYFEGDRKYIDRIDAFCLWGDKQLRAISENAEEVRHKCHVVGHPRHDVNCLPRKNREKDGMVVGVITRAVALNDYFKRSALDGFVTLLSDHYQYEYINKQTGKSLPSKRAVSKPAESIIVQALDAATTLRTIDTLRKSGYQVSLRVHPKEDVEVWKELIVRCNLGVEINDPKTPVTKWLHGLDYVIGPPSTSFYDAAMLGVTPISTSRLDGRRQQYIGELWEDNNRLMEHIFKPVTYEDLLDYMASGVHLKTEGGVGSILKEEADFPECRNSIERLCALCESLAGRKSSKGMLRIFFIIREFFYYAWKVKNFLLKIKENSASFALDRRTRRFIDGLPNQ